MSGEGAIHRFVACECCAVNADVWPALTRSADADEEVVDAFVDEMEVRSVLGVLGAERHGVGTAATGRVGEPRRRPRMCVHSDVGHRPEVPWRAR